MLQMLVDAIRAGCSCTCGKLHLIYVGLRDTGIRHTIDADKECFDGSMEP
jgi:formylmethanofuran dehydrogenase subunit E